MQKYQDVSSNTCEHVPFYDWNEWLYMYKHLFSSTYHKALQRAKIWRLRSQKIPHPIECTLTFVELLNSPTMDEHLQRFMFASAISRFVNGFTDKLNANKTVFTSMQDILNQKYPTFPYLVVETRLQCIHGELPSLSMLKSVAELSLDWFGIYFYDLSKLG